MKANPFGRFKNYTVMIKKGTKVKFPMWSDEVGRVDFIYANGQVDIKYTGHSGVVTAQSIKDLVKV